VRRVGRGAKRLVVLVAGGFLIVLGFVLGPVPFVPGFLFSLAGLALLATEFALARRWMERLKATRLGKAIRRNG